MQTNTFNEKKRIGDFLKYELDKMFCRENGKLLNGQNLLCGTILGAQLVGAAAVATAWATNTVGAGAMGAITVGTTAKRGVYKLVVVEPVVNAGNFVVYYPDGTLVGEGAVASAFNAGGLSFTLADATDYAAGDGFDIEVTGGTVKYGAFDPTATNGFQNVAGMLLYDYYANGADIDCVVLARGPAIIVDAANLVWGANVTTDAQKTAALAALLKLGIVSRQTV